MADFSFDLSGRIALVTGASSGFGARFARQLAAGGAKEVGTDAGFDGEHADSTTEP